jgi:hypothetical protein
MRTTLAAGIEAIFDILGWPETDKRQCALSVEKWTQLKVMYEIVLLGLVFNTRTMTVSITEEYRLEVIAMLKDWDENKTTFTVPEIEKLVGKIARIGQAFRAIYHLMPLLYSSTAHALCDNKSWLVNSSKKFRALIKQAKRGQINATRHDMRIINFATGRVARMQYRCKREYPINATLRNEMNVIKNILMDQTIFLGTPFAHIVPRTYTFAAACDACKEGGGGWSSDLAFYWFLEFPEKVVQRARLPNNKRGKLISINTLEFGMTIINLAAVMCALAHGIPCEDPHPVLLNYCDNIAACAWINYKCKESLIGRRLAMIYIGLILNSNLGVQAEWISTTQNFIADDISRLIKNSSDKRFDFTSLLKKYPTQLKGCRRFMPSEKLTSLIWDVLLSKDSPDPLTIRSWEPKTLGSFISQNF